MSSKALYLDDTISTESFLNDTKFSCSNFKVSLLEWKRPKVRRTSFYYLNCVGKNVYVVYFMRNANKKSGNINMKILYYMNRK